MKGDDFHDQVLFFDSVWRELAVMRIGRAPSVDSIHLIDVGVMTDVQE